MRNGSFLVLFCCLFSCSQDLFQFDTLLFFSQNWIKRNKVCAIVVYGRQFEGETTVISMSFLVLFCKKKLCVYTQMEGGGVNFFEYVYSKGGGGLKNVFCILKRGGGGSKIFEYKCMLPYDPFLVLFLSLFFSFFFFFLFFPLFLFLPPMSLFSFLALFPVPFCRHLSSSFSFALFWSFGGLSKYSSQNPLPVEYYLSINFWPAFSNTKEISVYEYYFWNPGHPPPPFEYWFWHLFFQKSLKLVQMNIIFWNPAKTPWVPRPCWVLIEY